MMVWSLLLIVGGIIVLQLVERRRLRQERAGHGVGRARVPGADRRWCPLCGYTFVHDDIVRRVIGVDGATVVHADDCGPAPRRVKLAPPTHDLTPDGTLTRRRL